MQQLQMEWQDPMQNNTGSGNNSISRHRVALMAKNLPFAVSSKAGREKRNRKCACGWNLERTRGLTDACDPILDPNYNPRMEPYMSPRLDPRMICLRLDLRYDRRYDPRMDPRYAASKRGKSRRISQRLSTAPWSYGRYIFEWVQGKYFDLCLPMTTEKGIAMAQFLKERKRKKIPRAVQCCLNVGGKHSCNAVSEFQSMVADCKDS